MANGVGTSSRGLHWLQLRQPIRDFPEALLGKKIASDKAQQDQQKKQDHKEKGSILDSPVFCFSACFKSPPFSHGNNG